MATSRSISHRHTDSIVNPLQGNVPTAQPQLAAIRWDLWMNSIGLHHVGTNHVLQRMWSHLTLRCLTAYQQVIHLSEAHHAQLRSNIQMSRQILQKKEELEKIGQQENQVHVIFTQEMKEETAQLSLNLSRIKQDLTQLKEKQQVLQEMANFSDEKRSLDAFQEQFTADCKNLNFPELISDCQEIGSEQALLLQPFESIEEGIAKSTQDYERIKGEQEQVVQNGLQQRSLLDNIESDFQSLVRDQKEFVKQGEELQEAGQRQSLELDQVEGEFHHIANFQDILSDIEPLSQATASVEEEGQRQRQELQQIQKDFEELQKLLEDIPKPVQKKKIIVVETALKMVSVSQKPVFNFSVKHPIHSLLYRIFFISSNLMWRIMARGSKENPKV